MIFNKKELPVDFESKVDYTKEQFFEENIWIKLTVSSEIL